MTVEQLIKELKKHPSHLNVEFADWQNYRRQVDKVIQRRVFTGKANPNDEQIVITLDSEYYGNF